MPTPTWTHVGNCADFTWTPKQDLLKHKTSMAARRFTDFIAATGVECTFDMTLQEWTLDNLAMATLGLKVTDASGDMLQICGAGVVYRMLKFEGQNDIGPKFEIILDKVMLSGQKAIGIIAKESDTNVMDLPISGEMLLADPLVQSFGTIRTLDGATGDAPVTSPDVLNYYYGLGNVYTAPVA